MQVSVEVGTIKYIRMLKNEHDLNCDPVILGIHGECGAAIETSKENHEHEERER